MAGPPSTEGPTDTHWSITCPNAGVPSPKQPCWPCVPPASAQHSLPGLIYRHLSGRGCGFSLPYLCGTCLKSFICRLSDLQAGALLRGSRGAS